MPDSNLLQQIESALEEEYNQYSSILDLSEEQTRLLAEKDPDVDRIADLMAKKIAVLDEIKNLESRHRPLKDSWDKLYENYSENEKKRIAEWKDNSLRLIERLKDIEDRIAEDVKKIENGINRRLRDIHKGKEVQRAYFKYEAGPPRFVDRKK
ncbi:MAG: flagellar export chaperone FlgN [Candidatus Omnitrophota bacterium]